MKRVPFYRRPGKKGKFTGFKERVIWMIQTRGTPVTGTEIAEKFGVTLKEFNRIANTLTRGDQTVKVVASPTWKTETGIVDRFSPLKVSQKSYAHPERKRLSPAKAKTKPPEISKKNA